MLPSTACELLNAPRQGACALLDILKLLLRGVWTGRRTCWSGCGRKSGIVCCFFFSKTNTYLSPIQTFSIWESEPFGRETIDIQWQCPGCGWRTAVKRCYESVFELSEIWKKQKFFFPPLLLLSCQILLSFSARVWQSYRNGPGLTFLQTVLHSQTLHLF